MSTPNGPQWLARRSANSRAHDTSLVAGPVAATRRTLATGHLNTVAAVIRWEALGQLRGLRLPPRRDRQQPSGGCSGSTTDTTDARSD